MTRQLNFYFTLDYVLDYRTFIHILNMLFRKHGRIKPKYSGTKHFLNQ